MKLEQNDIKNLYDLKLLSKAAIHPIGKDYQVVITNKAKGSIYLITAKGHVRIFKTIQVAINTLEKIGFKKIEVNL